MANTTRVRDRDESPAKVVKLFRLDGPTIYGDLQSHLAEVALENSLDFNFVYWKKESIGWKLRQRGNWYGLVDRDRMRASAEDFAKQKLSEDLAASGWEIEESEPERLRLRRTTGGWVTVVTRDYLSAPRCRHWVN